MALPEFNAEGELPLGVHRASLGEVVARFGTSTAVRQEVARRLVRVYNVASGTGLLLRFVVFGSFITAKPEPNDVDVFLLLDDSFVGRRFTGDAALLFDHLRAHDTFGASVFCSTRGGILGTEQDLIEYWQIKRDGSFRGIVEIVEG